ncbi:hypothetical protein H8959_014143 [Pygathrix nigripes]
MRRPCSKSKKRMAAFAQDWHSVWLLVVTEGLGQQLVSLKPGYSCDRHGLRHSHLRRKVTPYLSPARRIQVVRAVTRRGERPQCRFSGREPGPQVLTCGFPSPRSSARMALVFLYGTLKRGQPNHRVLRDSAHGSAAFRARGRTLDPYPLGEVYAVDERMLRFLDDFESCPALYQRTALRVQLLEEGAPGAEEPPVPNTVQCFVYSRATFPPEWAQLPHHDSYDSEGPHGLRYNPRENR